MTVTKQDLINMGYGSSYATDIIKQAKALMVSKGYTYYLSKKLNRVPAYAVNEILGIDIQPPFDKTKQPIK